MIATRATRTDAERRRLVVARERVQARLAGMLDGLDEETRIETCRAGIRALAQAVKAHGGEGRAAGVLCGALVDVSPSYRVEKRFTEAEALFSRPAEPDED